MTSTFAVRASFSQEIKNKWAKNNFHETFNCSQKIGCFVKKITYAKHLLNDLA